LNDELSYPIAGIPAEGQTIEVAPGLLWVRMPIPIPGLLHINLWLLDEGDGWTVVDTGLRSRTIQGWWEKILADLGGKPVKRVICTHFHPDHMGNAGWFHETYGVLPTMTMGEWAFGRMLLMDAADGVPPDVVAFNQANGLDEDAIEKLKARGYNNLDKAIAPMPRGFHRLVDGQVLEIGGRHWRVIVGRGHSPEHACLYCAELRVLIAGDQVLPKISPHIGIYIGEPEGDPLSLYLESLPLFKTLPADTLVLPAHGEPFRGLHKRAEDLIQHHEVRLARLDAALADWTKPTDVLPLLFKREITPDIVIMAVGEALAHLHHLWRSGRAERQTGPDGVHRFRRTRYEAAAAE